MCTYSVETGKYRTSKLLDAMTRKYPLLAALALGENIVRPSARDMRSRRLAFCPLRLTPKRSDHWIRGVSLSIICAISKITPWEHYGDPSRAASFDL